MLKHNLVWILSLKAMESNMVLLYSGVLSTMIKRANAEIFAIAIFRGSFVRSPD